MGNTLLATLDDDFVGLGNDVLATVTRFDTVTREGDLDVVLVLETDNVLATSTNERRVELARDLQDLGSLIRLVRLPFALARSHEKIDEYAQTCRPG